MYIMQWSFYLYIIVVVDTNAWFHGTFVHEGNISITFGAEYNC